MKETPLVMPKMSMTMEEGILVDWHKSEGDEIRSGEVVCEVTTDKVDMEVESPLEGTLVRIVAQPEDVIPVGEPMAYLATEADDLLEGLLDGPTPTEAASTVPAPAGRARTEPAPEPEHVRPAATAQGSVAAVPYARKRAEELGVDLTTLTPTGPHNTIRLSDVQHAVQDHQPRVTPAYRTTADQEPEQHVEEKPAKRTKGSTRGALARKMSASAQVPQFVVYRDLNLDTARREGCGWTTVLTHAFAHALRAHPALNASWVDDDVRRLDDVVVALAADTPRGLLAPVLHNPDLVTLPVLQRRTREVLGRAQDGTLTAAELDGATTTVSNLGGWQVHSFNALLTPPQATALSLGAVGPQVVPVGDGIGVRTRCRVGLTVDHRIGDGADAARLLATMQQLLDAAEPEEDL